MSLQKIQQDNYKYRNPVSLLEAIKFIDYCPKTGKITHNARKNSNGSYDKDGYLIIKIKGLQWKAHRLAWAKYYGKPPKNNIDHINGDKTDNRISNLRDAPQVVNVHATKRKPNKDTGVVGVYKDKATKGLRAIYCCRHKKKVYRFRTLSEAVQFRKERGVQV